MIHLSRQLPHYFCLLPLIKLSEFFYYPGPPHYVVVWISSHGHPSLKLVSVFILGVVFIRVAGYVINNFVDSNIDQHIRRT